MFRFSFTDEQIIQKIRSRLKRYTEINFPFLVLILPNNFKVDEPFEELKALFFDYEHFYESGTAEGYVGRNGVCAFRNIIWKE